MQVLTAEERVSLRTGATKGVSEGALAEVGGDEKRAVELLLEQPAAQPQNKALHRALLSPSPPCVDLKVVHARETLRPGCVAM